VPRFGKLKDRLPREMSRVDNDADLVTIKTWGKAIVNVHILWLSIHEVISQVTLGNKNCHERVIWP
jgi:hypothetical protein